LDLKEATGDFETCHLLFLFDRKSARQRPAYLLRGLLASGNVDPGERAGLSKKILKVSEVHEYPVPREQWRVKDSRDPEAVLPAVDDRAQGVLFDMMRVSKPWSQDAVWSLKKSSNTDFLDVH
jgi:hypothetical protein